MKFKPFNADRIKPLTTIKLRVPKVDRIKQSLPPQVIEWWQLFLIRFKSWLNNRIEKTAEIGFRVFFQQNKLIIWAVIIIVGGLAAWMLLK